MSDPYARPIRSREAPQRRAHRRRRPRCRARDAEGHRDRRRGARAPARRHRDDWIETMPCNWNQRELARHVRRGIIEAGGTPVEFNTIAVSDGVSMGTEGMRASLVSRETIADSIELVVRGHLLDGLVCLVGCDKTIPAAVMALARLDRARARPLQRLDRAGTLPRPRRHDPGRLRGGRRRRRRDDEQRRRARARGRRLPGRRRVRRPVHREHDGDGRSSSSASAPPASTTYRRQIRRSTTLPTRPASIAMRLVRDDVRPSQMITRDALENAVAAIAATGGSTNGVLHLLAIAYELGIDADDRRVRPRSRRARRSSPTSSRAAASSRPTCTPPAASRSSRASC